MGIPKAMEHKNNSILEEQLLLEDCVNLDTAKRASSRLRSRQARTSIFLGLWLALDIVLLLHISYSKTTSSPSLTASECLSLRRSPYSGLAHDTPVRYTRESDYVSPNKTLADEMWKGVENLLAIQVSETWAKEKDLQPSWPFAWDLDKKVYFPKIGHQLHCIKTMRRAVHELLEQGSTSAAQAHLDHCFDTLRQDLMCYADDTPMGTVQGFGGLGEGQVMQCKNWDKVIEWIRDPQRHACYRHINGWTSPAVLIERYGFCPPESVHYPIMNQYFQVHGHMQAIEDWN